MRRPWCAFAYQQQSSRRVQVTVLVGAFVRFAAFEVLGVSLAFLGTRALSRLWPSDTFENSTAGGNPYFETFDRFAVVLISA